MGSCVREIVIGRFRTVRSIAGVGIALAIIIGYTNIVTPNRHFLPQGEMLYRQKIAKTLLDEKSLMAQIIDRLDHQLSDIDRARIAPVLVEEARQYGSDPLFLVAVIITESSFGPAEVSQMGARGLMQIKPSVARAVAERSGMRWINDEELFDPAYNVRLGSHYLFELVARFGSVKRAIIAYNYGETAVNWRIETGQRLPSEYFERVKNNYHVLREQFGPQVPWKPVQFDKTIQ